MVNSLVPRRCGCNLKSIIFKLISRTDVLCISCEISLRWMPEDLTDDKSTLVQVMAWVPSGSKPLPDQCWPSCIYPYGITRGQWVEYGRKSAENQIDVRGKFLLRQKPCACWRSPPPPPPPPHTHTHTHFYTNTSNNFVISMMSNGKTSESMKQILHIQN